MAKIRYFGGWPSDLIFPPDEGLVLESTDTYAHVLSAMAGDARLFIGRGFVASGDRLVSGIVTQIDYLAGNDPEGLFYRLKDFEWDLSLTPMERWPTIVLQGNDVMLGSAFHDVLKGWAGNDDIRGRHGSDSLIGDEGNDLLKGGPGRDNFYFASGDGIDIILDFNAFGRGTDQIFFNFTDEDFHVSAHQRGSDIVVQYGGDDKIILLDVDFSDFSMRDLQVL